jgi:hypothetical protein
MKHLVTLGLIGCALTAACGVTATPAPARTATARSVAGLCSGPVVVRKQADVRSIGTMCTVIDGDLVISNTSVKNLDGLERVHSVRFLVVTANPALESIEGLRGLTSARGITLMDNPALRSLHGLEALPRLDGAVIVGNGVTSLDGLSGLNRVGELVVADNLNLADVGGIAAVASTVDVEANGPEGATESRAAVASAKPGTEG